MSFVEQFRSSSPTRQLALALIAMAIIGVVLSAGYFLVLRRPYAVLYANLRPADAATLVAELDKRKTPYRLAQGGATILAPQDQVDATRLALANEDLPLKGAVGFELFNKSDMGLTEFAQKINYQRALQGELARTIMTIDGVDSARVHLSIADPTLFRDDRRPSKASITLALRPGAMLSDRAVRGIQRLAASAVPDLAAEDVVVLDQSGAAISGPPNAAPTEDGSPQAVERRAVEQYYASRIMRALSASAQAADAKVTVSALVAPGPSSIEGQGAALEAWTPSSRDFPLAVNLAFPSLPDASVQDQVRALAAKAAGLDTDKGDVVTFAQATSVDTAVSDPPPTVTRLGSGPPVPATPVPTGTSATTFWEVHLIPLLIALLGVAFWVHRSRRGERRLSPAQRERFVGRLRTFLEEGREHAA